MIKLLKPSLPDFLKNKTVLVFLLLVMIMAAVASWSYVKYYRAQSQLNQLLTQEGQQKLAEQEVETLLNQIKTHMVLPNEKPTVATVTDAEALKKNQPFFADAQNGDKVIVYVATRKAIIFSPERDLIINVGTVAVDGGGEPAPTPSQQQPATIQPKATPQEKATPSLASPATP